MSSGFRLEEESKDISLHFSQIAKQYRYLRRTDLEPVIYITQMLNSRLNLSHIDTADIGCGDGRYSLLLSRYLDGRLRLRCVDNNEHMLETLTTYLNTNGVGKFEIVKAGAESLPFGDNSLDCVFTFNAVHHFKLRDFLVESARVLRDRGLLFIYTRTLRQNSRNIWGRYFPQFYQKETRLYHLDEIKRAVSAIYTLELLCVEYFKYERVASLDHLLNQARNRHYSTFWFYSDEDFVAALDGFQQNIRENFSNPNEVRWFDENLVLVIEKKS